MSVSALSSSLYASVAASPGTANQFATDLNQVASDLQSGNLSAAQEDYVTLSDDARNGATASSATTSASNIGAGLLSAIGSSSSGANTFVADLNQLGDDLANGDLGSSQTDMLTLDADALGASAQAAPTPAGSAGASSPAASTSEVKELVSAAVAAMGAGDDSLAGSVLSSLASLAPSSAGASYLQSMSASLAGVGDSSSSVASLIQSSSATGAASSGLSLLA